MILLRELRTLAGITQKELAEKIRSTQTTIGKYERGELEPSIDTLKLFSRIFEVSVDYIIGNSDDFGVISIETEKPALTKDELSLLTTYRALSEKNQTRVSVYASVRLEEQEEHKSIKS